MEKGISCVADRQPECLHTQPSKRRRQKTIGRFVANTMTRSSSPAESAQLKVWLNKLHAQTKITLLRSDNRLILTAAAADRNSFGCHDPDRNTWFIGQLLGPHFSPQSTWDNVFTATRTGIERQEKFQQVSPPSNSQIDGNELHRKMTLKGSFRVDYGVY